MRFIRQNGERVISPPPDLISLRATSGLFYDVVGGGDRVTNEIGERFESYCVDLAKSMLRSLIVEGSRKYNIGNRRLASPDMLIHVNRKLTLIFECKATRLSYEARLGENPIAQSPRGYDELATGVFQIWRFISHLRQQVLPDLLLSEAPTGVVLTLNPWLVMSAEMQDDVIAKAKEIASKRDPEVSIYDQIPVAFCTVEDLEISLAASADDSFVRSIKAKANEHYRGWYLHSVHREIAPEEELNKRFPFEDRMTEVLPWWNSF